MLLKMRAILLAVGLFLGAALPPASLSADDDAGGDGEGTELAADRLHAPLPLYTFAWRDLWPRSIEDPGPEIIVGCESRVAFGDWQFVPKPVDESGREYWLRVANYGAFHCAANLYEAEAQDALDEGDFSRGLFARIGEGRASGKTYELWVLQHGFIPGSSYTLLARETAQDDGLVERFHVLQRRCPSGKLREAEEMDVWLTRYCAVANRTELLALARRMLREEFLGELLRKSEEGPEAQASDPSETD